MVIKKRMQVEALNWKHISVFGSFGESLKSFADKNGYVCWDMHIYNEAKLLSQEELEFEYNAWVSEMQSSDWGDAEYGSSESDDPEDYPDWRYLRNGAAAYAVEKAIRNLKMWKGK